MAASVHACNLALSHIADGKEIANLETDKSQEAQACRRFYRTALRATLRDFPWPFASVSGPLALVAGCLPGEIPPTIPLPGCEHGWAHPHWRFLYQVPSTALHFMRVLSDRNMDTRQSRISYIIVNSPTGKQLYTNRPFAWGEWIIEADNPALWDADFELAFSFRLAMYIAPRLTGGDPFKLGDRAARFYDAELRRAQSTAVNEEQMEQDPESEFVRTRD
jgi:hypothetical protein